MSQEEPISKEKMDAMTKAYESHFGVNLTHKPDSTTAGQVGVERLLVAREGEQRLASTGSQLGVGLPLDTSKDKGGEECHAVWRRNGCEHQICEGCGYYY